MLPMRLVAGGGRAALRPLVLGWALALLAGCALHSAALADLSPSVAQHFYPTRAPGVYLDQPVWLRDGAIVVVFDPAGAEQEWDVRMLAVKADGSSAMPLREASGVNPVGRRQSRGGRICARSPAPRASNRWTRHPQALGRRCSLPRPSETRGAWPSMRPAMCT